VIKLRQVQLEQTPTGRCVMVKSRLVRRDAGVLDAYAASAQKPRSNAFIILSNSHPFFVALLMMQRDGCDPTTFRR
jgi:hypothetical protein